MNKIGFRLLAALICFSLFLPSCSKSDEPDASGEGMGGSPESPAPCPGGAFAASHVFEWMPAPGQFINEADENIIWDSSVTPEMAAAWAKTRLDEGLYVTLGGFGGYIIVGFDHSIINTGGYNIGILGNSFLSDYGGSNEPGVVYVMMDENSNGLPDDTWYELRGSATFSPETIRDYSVTYFRPTTDHAPVKWRDSFGDEGEIPYLGLFHSQPTYYPVWQKSESYTLTGTLLAGSDRAVPEQWGYADNMGEDNIELDRFPNCNRFRISDAITADGASIYLPFIDFVKVQCAVAAQSDLFGEASTEVLGFVDLNM